MGIRTNYRISTLDDELKELKLKKEIDESEKKVINNLEEENLSDKTVLKSLLKTGVIVGPTIVTFVIAIMLNNLTILSLGVGLSLASGFTILTKYLVNNIKSFKNNRKNENNIISLEEEKNKKKQAKAIEEYRSSNYDKVVVKNYGENEETKKYKEALEKQLKEKYGVEYLTKNETIDRLLKEIDVYLYTYKLPKFNVSMDDWDYFLNITYCIFEKNNNQSLFYSAMSRVVRYTLANILINNKQEITIKDFINSLDYITYTIWIDKVIIDSVKHNLLNKFQYPKVFEFKDYSRKLMRK